MAIPPRAWPLRAARALAWLAFAIALGAGATEPKRVLILHSFGRDFAPYDTIASVFRTELAQRAAAPITFVEANLDSGRVISNAEESAFLAYLRARFGGAAPDVVVTIGAQAARFYVRHRDELFANSPMVIGALDERLARQIEFRPGDTIVAGRVELPKLVDNMLRLLPGTETIAVVLGASELERFWRAELKRELAPFADRVKFEFLDGLSLPQMQDRIAALPPHSAVFYALLIVDGAGVPHERQDALARLYAVANAPIFGIYEDELGKGVVGGPYTSQRRNGEDMAEAAIRALTGMHGSQPALMVNAFEGPVYDWRELARWGIDSERLPPGSVVRFKRPSIWEEYRVTVLAATIALSLQAALIIALLAQGARRRRAEREAEGLAGRLVTAHEDERRRLARELHDDVTQRLAGLAIEVAQLEGGARGATNRDASQSIRKGLADLSEDVHALSYRLHPSVIEDLGLEEALRIECDRVARQQSLRVNFDCRDVPRRLPASAALCLFRVAQEALRNVERHARANHVEVSVARKDGGIALAVRDDGVGFDVSRSGERASLGLASMRERVRLHGGRFDIESARGSGTSLLAWVPLREAA